LDELGLNDPYFSISSSNEYFFHMRTNTDAVEQGALIVKALEMAMDKDFRESAQGHVDRGNCSHRRWPPRYRGNIAANCLRLLGRRHEKRCQVYLLVKEKGVRFIEKGV
jgi:hypothetical protein